MSSPRGRGERLTRVSRFGHLALRAGDPDDGRMWRRWRREPPLEARDVQTMMDVLFDLRSDTTEILRILWEDQDGEEEAEEIDG